MRAAPAFQVVIKQFSAWCLAVGMLATMSWLALLMWWVTFAWSSLPAAWWVHGGMLVAATATVGLVAVKAWRMPSLSLRWDQQLWQLKLLSALPHVMPCSGHISVALDLGPWMLLCFEPLGAAPTRWSARRWLPVQRSNLLSSWHLLRCAVYSPQAKPSPVPIA